MTGNFLSVSLARPILSRREFLTLEAQTWTLSTSGARCFRNSLAPMAISGSTKVRRGDQLTLGKYVRWNHHKRWSLVRLVRSSHEYSRLLVLTTFRSKRVRLTDHEHRLPETYLIGEIHHHVVALSALLVGASLQRHQPGRLSDRTAYR